MREPLSKIAFLALLGLTFTEVIERRTSAAMLLFFLYFAYRVYRDEKRDREKELEQQKFETEKMRQALRDTKEYFEKGPPGQL